MGTIEVVAGVIAALIYIECQAAIVVGLKAHAFAESVRGGGRKTVREAPVKFCLQSVVAGGEPRKEKLGRGGSPEGGKFGLPGIAQANDGSGVEVIVDHGVDTVAADVS